MNHFGKNLINSLISPSSSLGFSIQLNVKLPPPPLTITLLGSYIHLTSSRRKTILRQELKITVEHSSATATGQGRA